MYLENRKGVTSFVIPINLFNQKKKNFFFDLKNSMPDRVFVEKKIFFFFGENPMPDAIFEV